MDVASTQVFGECGLTGNISSHVELERASGIRSGERFGRQAYRDQLSYLCAEMDFRPLSCAIRSMKQPLIAIAPGPRQHGRVDA